MTKRRTISVHTRLRPIRLGFLLPPNDSVALRRAIQICTIRWGGKHSVMIPMYRRLPNYWKRYTQSTALEVVQGYLRAFSPDYLVEMESGISSSIDFPIARIITPEHVYYPRSRDEGIMGYGLDVSFVYEDLYNQEFKFDRRNPLQVILPSAADPQYALFVAASFGEFPSDEKAAYFEESLRSRFSAQETAVSGNNFCELLKNSTTNPLRMGSTGVQVSRSGYEDGFFLYYCDPRSWSDIVDCWNLRAAGHHFLPIPRDWANDLIPISEEIIRESYRPYRYNPNIMECVRLVHSLSCSDDEARSFLESLAKPAENSVMQEGPPSVWAEGKYRRYSSEAAHVINSKEADADIEVIDGRMVVPPLSPSFGSFALSRNMPTWMNIFQFRDHSESMFSAPVLPEHLEDWSEVAGDLGMDRTWVSREGVVTPVWMGAWSHHWQAPTAIKLMEVWMKENGLKLKISSAGRVATEIARKLGRYGVNLLAAEEIIMQLNRMTHGLSEIEVGADDTGRVRKVNSPASPRTEWIKLLTRTFPHRSAESLLKYFLEREVLRVGLRIQCEHCQQYNWYDPDTLSSRLTCVRCIQEFRFPGEKPPKDGWSYRAVGPFAIENYALGSYPVILAYRFLVNVLRATATWIPSIELLTQQGEQLEADFAMLWQNSDYLVCDPVPIFGECKAYNKFESRDFKRMNQLGALFPGAILAFCTLRNELLEQERKVLARLVRGERTRGGRERRPNRVLILTGTELFCASGLEGCWTDEKRFNQEIVKGFEPPHQGGIEELCRITQHFHLGLK